MEKDIKGRTEKQPVERQEEPYTGGQEWYAVRNSRVLITFPAEKNSGPDENETGQDVPDGQDPAPPPPPQPQLYSEQGEKDVATQDGLLFYGAVREENNKAVEGVAVMVFACCSDHTERLLGYTISGSEGAYLINLPDLPDYNDITGFIVRAGGAHREPEKTHGSRAGYEEKKRPDSPNKDFNSFLRFIYNNPNKSLHELVKGFY
ncbi:MAG: hypothetical protein JL50_19740 [Peptococcaceae bacterium BICA1-7]|nr:MAG: hypothetical protein JL50_19740 [Peptococcaceae bacterium BICA1-7]HBV98310.1 hypothetical protein [Desulfotomaculum sp.]